MSLTELKAMRARGELTVNEFLEMARSLRYEETNSDVRSPLPIAEDSGRKTSNTSVDLSDDSDQGGEAREEAREASSVTGLGSTMAYTTSESSSGITWCFPHNVYTCAQLRMID